MNISVRKIECKIVGDDIFKATIWNESLHLNSNDSSVRIVNSATSKNLFLVITNFPHQNIHKYTWNSADEKTRNQIDHTLIDRK
jgi:hypothetical protein